MKNTDFLCYGDVTLVDPTGEVITCGASGFTYSAFKYVDLREYGGSEYTPVSGNSSLQAALQALGYSVTIIECQIFFTDILKPAKSDIPVKNDPAIQIIALNSPSCTNDAIDYSLFEFIDLAFYGGGTVEIPDEPALITAFADIGISVTISECFIILNDWADKPIQNIVGSLHSRASIVGKTSQVQTCNGGALDFTEFGCIDLTPYGGAAYVKVDSAQDILDALTPLVTPAQIFIDGCEVAFKFESGPKPNIVANEFKIIQLVDTDEGIVNLCSGGAYDYSKFEYIDLTGYGGPSSVRVTNNAEVVAAFSALGIEVEFTGCDILIKECRSNYPNVEVSKAPSITLVDTDEGLTPCGANGFAFAEFDAANFCHYDTNNILGDCANVELNSNQDIIDVFNLLGITAEVVDCVIKLYNWSGPLVDIEVCKYPTIQVVDFQGNPMCENNALPFNLIESIDMSPYGGPAAYSPVVNNSSIVQAFADQGIDVEVDGCDIKFQHCYGGAADIQATSVEPVMTADINFIGGDDGVYEATLGAYLIKNGVQTELSAGDRIKVAIVSRGVDVELVVGGNPTVLGSGYINDTGGKWASEIIPHLANVQTLTPASLLAESYVLQFKKRTWAIATSNTYMTTGPSAAKSLLWEFRAEDVSAGRISPVASVLMKKIVTMLDGMIASTHLLSLKTQVDMFGHPTINGVTAVSHKIAGIERPVSFLDRMFVNGVERERWEGTYANFSSNQTVDITVDRDNGWTTVSRGYLRQDSDFLLRVPCSTNDPNQPGCLIQPYGEHEEGSQPSSWGFSFQALAEYLHGGMGNVPPQSGKIFYDGVQHNVTFSNPGNPALWNSQVIQLTNLVIGVQHSVRCEAMDVIFNNLAYLEFDLEIVALY